MLHPLYPFPQVEHYWLKNAHVPIALFDLDSLPSTTHQTREGLVCVDLEIRAGRISQIRSSDAAIPEAISETDISVEEGIERPVINETPVIDVRRGIVFPCFVDMHTHLDKGHLWERSPNLEGTFNRALEAVQTDSERYWAAEDVFRRMEFGLKCSYAHGTRAIRTHIDSFGNQAEISLEVFQTLKEQWRDRLTLQAVSLVSLDYFQTPAGEKLADRIAEVGGVLGGLPIMNEALNDQLDWVFILAKERQLDLDFHTDESGDPDAVTLRHVAAAALRHNFPGQIVCGHCCSLAVQPAEEVQKTIDLVKQAQIGIVSLPMCNLYLQDRYQTASAKWVQDNDPEPASGMQTTASNASNQPLIYSFTPRWRGVTLLHELKQFGIPVAVASDNCRDPFYGFGDHDVLEVLTQATRIAHLDAPYSDWCRTVTTTAADLIGLPQLGRIGVGLSADLIVFKARYYSELLSRPQADRLVLRNGQPIDTTLPDYAELDDLL